jgi:hypothetical protein
VTTDTTVLPPITAYVPAGEPPTPWTRQAVRPLKPARNGVFASVALLVFPPTGIPALVNAFGVDQAWFEGQPELAQRRSQRALMWSWISVAAAVLLTVVATLTVVRAVSAAVSTVQPAMDTLSSVNELLNPSAGSDAAPAPGAATAPDVAGDLETLQQLSDLLSGDGGQVSGEDVGRLVDDLGGLIGSLNQQS